MLLVAPTSMLVGTDWGEAKRSFADRPSMATPAKAKPAVTSFQVVVRSDGSYDMAVTPLLFSSLLLHSRENSNRVPRIAGHPYERCSSIDERSDLARLCTAAHTRPRSAKNPKGICENSLPRDREWKRLATVRRWITLCVALHGGGRPTFVDNGVANPRRRQPSRGRPLGPKRSCRCI